MGLGEDDYAVVTKDEERARKENSEKERVYSNVCLVYLTFQMKRNRSFSSFLFLDLVQCQRGGIGGTKFCASCLEEVGENYFSKDGPINHPIVKPLDTIPLITI